MTSIAYKAWDVADYYYVQLAKSVKYILTNILICIHKEQCSDQEESK
jgi:hypothetical protein